MVKQGKVIVYDEVFGPMYKLKMSQFRLKILIHNQSILSIT